jgi:hypothetical protein
MNELVPFPILGWLPSPQIYLSDEVRAVDCASGNSAIEFVHPYQLV